MYTTKWYGHDIEYPTLIRRYTGEDNMVYSTWELNVSTLPNIITSDGKDYILQGPTADNTFRWSHFSTGTSIFIGWPDFSSAQLSRGIEGIPRKVSVAQAFGAVSAALAGNALFTAGSNEHGALGTGRPMGADTMVSTGNKLPKYYESTFKKVPGEWKDMSVGMTNNGAIIWALDMDGALWATGGMSGGFSAEDSPINTFQKKNDGPWNTVVKSPQGMILAHKIEESVVDGNVVITHDFYSAFEGNFLLVFSAPAEEWDASMVEEYGRTATPEEWGMANEGARAGSHFSFIGGGLLDTWGKPAGSLWAYVGHEPELIDEGPCLHTAGAFSRLQEFNDYLPHLSIIASRRKQG